MRRNLPILLTAAFTLFAGASPLSTKMNTAVPDTPFSSANISLFLSGDVMTGRGIDQVLPHSVDPVIYESYVKDARQYVKFAEKENGPIEQPVSYDYIWGDALEVWRQQAPDLRIINLETSVTDDGEPWPGKGIQYRMHPKNTQVLKAAEIDFASLANNHSLDWGREGLLHTLQALDDYDITYAGAGKTLEEARQPAIFTTQKGRVIILAWGHESSGIPQSWAARADQPGVNLLPDLGEKSLEIIRQQVKRIKKQGDIVVFSVHWGSNWGWEVPAEQQRFARQLIDEAGVDLVHGHSSHHPRGIEVYKDKLILYGAGDFINDYEGIGGYEHFRGDLSLMYFPEIDPASGKLQSLKMVPMQVRNLRLNKASASDTKWLAHTLDRESRKFGASVQVAQDGSLRLDW